MGVYQIALCEPKNSSRKRADKKVLALEGARDGRDTDESLILSIEPVARGEKKQRKDGKGA